MTVRLRLLPAILATTIVFVILRLTGAIEWSWWWVFSPLWLPASVAVVIGVLLLVGIVILPALLQLLLSPGKTRK